MASADVIAEMDTTARRNLQRAMSVISDMLGVKPADFPVVRGDAAYRSAVELKTLAAWSQQVALEVLGQRGGDRDGYQRELKRQAFDWNSLPDEALREIALKRKVRNADNLLRDDLLRAVQRLSWEDDAPIDADPIPDASAPDYDAMSKADAIKRAEAAGMPVTAKTTKAEAVDYLLASDGVSEDAQAAMDTGAVEAEGG